MTTMLNSVVAALAGASRWINRKLFVLGAVAVAAMVIPTVADVAGGLFGFPLPSAQEYVEFLQLIMVYGGLGYVQDLRGHIFVEMFYERFPKTLQSCVRIALIGVTGVVFCFVAWRLWLLGLDKMHAGESSLMLGIPLCVMVFYACLGSAAMALSLLAGVVGEAAELARRRHMIPLLLALAVLVALACSGIWLSSYPWMAHKTLLGGLGMLFLMIMLLLGCPVGFSMLCIGFVGLLLSYRGAGPAFSMLGLVSYSTATNYMYSVVPMFILMGEFASQAGISRDLFQAANVWLGRLPGGLAVASVAGCAGFAAVSGDSMATAVTMSSVALPEMEKKNYHSGFACATLAAGGTLGILIPPSTGFIFYSLVTEESIARLFLAGIIPGLLLAALFILVVLIYAMRNPEKAPVGMSTTFAEKIRALRGVIGMVLLIGLVLGGILTGKFSPNQGGAVGAAGTLLYAVVMRRMNWAGFRKALVSTTVVTVKLMMILVGVGLLGNFFAATRVPFALADFVVNLGTNKYLIFAGVVILYIVLGCMVNVIPMILLTLPAIFPTIQAVGFDPVWFGVVSVVLMEMGQITPPVGINVFAMGTAAPHVSLGAIFRSIIPYFGMMMLMILILVMFPGLATWLPSVMM